MKTDELVQQMKAAAERAMPGPWSVEIENRPMQIQGPAHVIADKEFHLAFVAAWSDEGASVEEIEDGKANADHIAASNPTNVLALIAALEAANARADAAEAKVAGASKAVEQLFKAQRDSEDTAGTLPAKEAVKLVPRHWHRVMDGVRAARAALASEASS